jgi:hypothetical protein
MSYFLWSSEVYYRAHKSPPLDPILRHTNSVHFFSPCFFTIRFTVFFPYRTRSVKRSLCFPYKILYTFLLPHLIFLDFITVIIFYEKCKLRKFLCEVFSDHLYRVSQRLLCTAVYGRREHRYIAAVGV